MKTRSHPPVAPSFARACRAAGLRPWWAPGLLAAAITSAYAQTPSSPAPSASAAGSPTAQNKDEAKAEGGANLQTVTVSATRRRELVREVPLAISTISTDQLAETGAKSLSDYIANQPGVVLQNNTLADGNGSLVVRGLTVGLDNSPTTAIYADDVPIGSSFSASLPLFDMTLLDLGRIELLRGPQGTLYGTASMGGVLKYVTNAPDTGSRSGRVSLGLSSTHNGSLNRVATGAFNVPLQQDVAALRVAVFDSHDAGYIDATGPFAGSRVNRKDRSGGRVSLLLTPGRDLSIKLTAMQQRSTSEGSDKIAYGPVTRAPIAGELVNANLGAAEPSKIDLSLYSLTVDYDLGWARFSSITATQDYQYKVRTDVSDYFGRLLAGSGLGITSSYAEVNSRTKKDTQEFRLVSQTGGTFDWLVGAFYVKEEARLLNSYFAQSAVLGPVYLIGPEAPTSGTGQEYSVYGNVTWNVSKALSLTAGLRAAHNKGSGSSTNFGLLAGPVPVVTTPPEASDSPTTYLLTAKYKLSPQSNVYFRAASGYRTGGANPTPTDPTTGKPVPGVPANYRSDTVWSYEAGYKANFPGARASVEAALFDIEWKDLQQYEFIPLASYLTNVGRARIRGLELAGSVEAAKGLTLSGSAVVLDPVLLDPSASLQASAGARLPSSPRVAANVAARYRFSLADKPAFAAATLNHVGERNSSFVESKAQPNFVLPAYTQLDLSGGVTVGKADIGVFVRNATDKRGLVSAFTAQSAVGAPIMVRVIEPRTVGVNASWAF